MTLDKTSTIIFLTSMNIIKTTRILLMCFLVKIKSTVSLKIKHLPNAINVCKIPLLVTNRLLALLSRTGLTSCMHISWWFRIKCQIFINAYMCAVVLFSKCRTNKRLFIWPNLQFVLGLPTAASHCVYRHVAFLCNHNYFCKRYSRIFALIWFK